MHQKKRVSTWVSVPACEFKNVAHASTGDSKMEPFGLKDLVVDAGSAMGDSNLSTNKNWCGWFPVASPLEPLPKSEPRAPPAVIALRAGSAALAAPPFAPPNCRTVAVRAAELSELPAPVPGQLFDPLSGRVALSAPPFAPAQPRRRSRSPRGRVLIQVTTQYPTNEELEDLLDAVRYGTPNQDSATWISWQTNGFPVWRFADEELIEARPAPPAPAAPPVPPAVLFAPGLPTYEEFEAEQQARFRALRIPPGNGVDSIA